MGIFEILGGPVTFLLPQSTPKEYTFIPPIKLSAGSLYSSLALCAICPKYYINGPV